MYTIQTLNKIAAAGTKRFDTAAYTVTDTAENPDAIMVRSAAMHDDLRQQLAGNCKSRCWYE